MPNTCRVRNVFRVDVIEKRGISAPSFLCNATDFEIIKETVTHPSKVPRCASFSDLFVCRSFLFAVVFVCANVVLLRKFRL